jgi:hypothetical protein
MLPKGYKVYVSKMKNKKYDVYHNGKYLLSFGDSRMEQYEDKFGHYSKLDHHDQQRRKNFKSRFKKLIDENNINTPTYWSNKYLW